MYPPFPSLTPVCPPDPLIDTLGYTSHRDDMLRTGHSSAAYYYPGLTDLAGLFVVLARVC